MMIKNRITTRFALRNGTAALLVVAGAALLLYAMLAAHSPNLNVAGAALLAVGFAIPLLA